MGFSSMKISGISFFMIAAIMTTVVPRACVCDEPHWNMFDGTDQKNNEQIIFDIDGVNSSIHNACPDEDQVDRYAQDTDESYEDEASEYADEDVALSYDILNDDDDEEEEEDDDETDLDGDNESSSVENITKYKAERTIEKKLLAADKTEHVHSLEEIEVDIEEPELEQDTRTNIDSDAQGLETEHNQANMRHQDTAPMQTEHEQQTTGIQKKINGRQQAPALFVREQIDQPCQTQENGTSGSASGAYSNYPYDLMDYIQYVVVKIKMFLFDCFT